MNMKKTMHVFNVFYSLPSICYIYGLEEVSGYVIHADHARD